MSAPVTHEEVGIVLGLLLGGGALVAGLMTFLTALSDVTPSLLGDDIGCGIWLVGIGMVILGVTGLGAIL